MLLETDLVYLQFQHVTDLSGRETLVRITGKHLLIFVTDPYSFLYMWN